MATKPINVDVYELKTLIIDKCVSVAGHLGDRPPEYIDLGGVTQMIKRIGELHLAMAEAIAALPQRATQPQANSKNAPN